MTARRFQPPCLDGSIGQDLRAELAEHRRIADALIGPAAVDRVLGENIETIEAVVHQGVHAALALLSQDDDGARHALARVMVTEPVQAVIAGIARVHLQGEAAGRGWLGAAILAAVLVTPEGERAAFAAKAEALLELDREDWVAFGAACAGTATERSPRLESFGLADGTELTTAGRLLACALVNVCG